MIASRSIVAELAQHADALAIVTEWKEFRTPDFEALRAAVTPLP